ncbi:MAG: hypothetical protein A2Z20_05290 [Bdellovibrionales bacterium RBG_16_40_8]|nr:MAG: hypothetical protein A2Z20_05290 [Bdellovibrionales bacterium RBG_16_40_8]
MAFLKRNSSVLFFTLFFTCGCATSSFDVIKQGDFVVELKVTPDRILLECEPQPSHEIENAHGFLMYILDDKKTVITVAQFNVLDKEECFNGLRKIDKILKTGKVLYVGGMGNMTDSKARNDRKYTFPRLGTFHSNGKSLKFMVIANEHGLCYDAHDGDKGQCPREPFSLKY